MGVARVNFGEIMAAIEAKLIADGAVADASQVTWAVSEKNIPQLTGPFDVLLRARPATIIPQDGGAWDFRLQRYVDITIRSLSIKDSGGNNRKWIADQFILEDKILDSMLNEGPNYATFWPSKTMPSGAREFLTTMPVRVVNSAPPERLNDATAWGDSVCTLEIHYMPLLTPQGL